MTNNSLTITFSDEDLQSYDFRDGILTDVSENPPHDPTDYKFYSPRKLYKNTPLFNDKEIVDFACNFNLPLEHHRNISSLHFSKKLGKNVIRVKKSFTKDMENIMQWYLMKSLIEKWMVNLGKLGFVVSNYEIYGEFTQNRLIHGHGVVSIICSNGYAMGVSTLLGSTWVKITRGSIASLSKKNVTGKYDYAFSKCNNAISFLKYASKGPGQQAMSTGFLPLSINNV